MGLRPEDITKIIRAQIKNYENKLHTSETGIVILVGDGIAKAGKRHRCAATRKINQRLIKPNCAQNNARHNVSDKYSCRSELCKINKKLADNAKKPAYNKRPKIFHKHIHKKTAFRHYYVPKDGFYYLIR